MFYRSRSGVTSCKLQEQGTSQLHKQRGEGRRSKGEENEAECGKKKMLIMLRVKNQKKRGERALP